MSKKIVLILNSSFLSLNLKKFVLSLLSSLLFLNSMAMPFAVAKAADEEPSTWYNQGFTDWYVKVYGDESPPSEIFGERYTAAQVEWILYGLFAFVLNNTTDPQTTACMISNDLGDCIDRVKDFFKLSDISKENLATRRNNSFQIIIEDRPLSGITYFKRIARNYSLIPEANAQTKGFGFGALDPVLPLWQASRNIAFALVVLVVLILSFMIMFRVKISPQIVISAQSAIPKVMSGLVLITFSYAIAGFMVDLMYVVIGIISFLVSQASNTFSSTDYFFALTQGPGGTGIFGWIVGYFIMFVITLFGSLYFSNGLVAFISSVVTLWAGILTFLGIIIVVIMAIVLLFNSLKIIWMLLKTFANILILTIFAPFQILIGILAPNIGFGAWIKSYVANLAVFPVTGVLFLLAFTFCVQAFASILSSLTLLPGSIMDLLGDILKGTVVSLVVAPALNGGWPPLLGVGNNASSLIFVGTSVVIISLIPKTVEIIQGFITGKPFAYGSAIGETIGPVVGLGKAGVAGGLNVLEDERRKRGYTDPALITSIARAIGLYRS